MEWCDLAREMDARTLRDVDAYRVERSRVYSSEQRFKDDVYWTASGPALPVPPRISSARELSSHGDGELI